MRRRPSKRSKTTFVLVGMGVATGIAAVLLWPQLRSFQVSSLISVGKPTMKQTQAQIAALLGV